MDQQHTTAVAGNAKMRTALVVIIILALGVLAFMNYKQRMDLEQQLSKVSLTNNQQVGNQQNVEAAKRIIEKVKRHFAIPGDVDPTVATIVDVETLKARNEFYKSAKNGDHLIITPTRAILYDPDKDLIIDVVPVQLTPQQPASSASSAPAAAMSSSTAR
ncbi:MAG TPA: hypothetical protein PKV72_01985 [Candidatus Peribacteria bacterium]|nr:hypothetical protein [Candidatus Peribacteria bacterium]